MRKKLLRRRSIRMKLMLVLLLSTFLILVVNITMYYNIGQITKHLDEIYAGNMELADLEESLELLQTSVKGYLNTKTTDAMSEYYKREQDFANNVDRLSDKVTDAPLLLMERNIKALSESYRKLTSMTVEAKRGRNVEKYKDYYEQSQKVFKYLGDAIASLNTQSFRFNSASYEALSVSLTSLERISIVVFALIGIFDVLIVLALTNSITEPLSKLSEAANQVAEGRFDEAGKVPVRNMDEIGVVTVAFNQMVESIPDYIDRLKEGMEKERLLKEKELLMESHLKDARLKYLQAQINPHFLFNTLNAGAQLAMMESADRTYSYVQKVADFFRYNIQKDNDEVTLEEEIRLVDTYIYILNVRFSGEIHFEKKIEDPSLLKLYLPSMILQPIMENSVNHGIRNMGGEGRIELAVYRVDDTVCISIMDNGIGMDQATIDKILSGDAASGDGSGNGVGMVNVMQRLSLYFEGRSRFEILSDGRDQGTEVVITIPAEGLEA
ncbi:MAG: histidine kinase [Lachnospiraceae bacterium]|nr:histidine kinase [Lachnospiraceae bacterium]